MSVLEKLYMFFSTIINNFTELTITTDRAGPIKAQMSLDSRESQQLKIDILNTWNSLLILIFQNVFELTFNDTFHFVSSYYTILSTYLTAIFLYIKFIS